jgi:hypothetical protein
MFMVQTGENRCLRDAGLQSLLLPQIRTSRECGCQETRGIDASFSACPITGSFHRGDSNFGHYARHAFLDADIDAED